MNKNFTHALATALAAGNITAGKETAAIALTTEEAVVEVAETKGSKLLETVTKHFTAENAPEATDSVDTIAFREARLTGAKHGAALATDGQAVVTGTRKPKQLDYEEASMGSDVISHTSEKRELATESFDGQSLESIVYFSSAVGTTLGAQDDFARTFFPPILVTSNTSSVSVESRIVKITESFSRDSLSPDAKKRNVKLLTNALTDTSVLETASHRLYAVKRAGTTSVLCDAPYTVELAKGDITSAPLKFGKSIPLSFVSKTDANLENGLDDETFALVGKIDLDAVYYTVGAETFKVDTGLMPYRNFIYNKSQGDHKDMSLSFKTNKAHVKIGVAKTYNNAESAVLADIDGANGYTVTLAIAIHGGINTRDADAEVYASKLEIEHIRDEKGVIVESGAIYDKIVAAFAGMKLVGYDLEVYASNANLTHDGQFITADVQSYSYAIPVLSPIIIQKQIANAGIDGDTAYLGDVITTLGAKTSALAVRTITSFSDRMRLAIENAGGNQVEFSGAGRDYVGQRFATIDLDMGDIVDSLRSADRTIDIQAALVNYIRQEVSEMGTSTAYAPVFRLPNHAGAGATITVAIGTDPEIATYLTSDKIDLGEGYNAKVVVSPYSEMKGKIIFTFIVEDKDRYTKPNPLNFGQMFIAPEIVADVPRQVANSGVVRHIITNPVALCEINLPILTTINVTGMDKVLKRVVLQNRVVAK